MSAPELDPAAALALLALRITPLQEFERVSVAHGLDRVLAADVVATLDVPPFDNAAMDGYALNSAGRTPERALRVVGRALAGHPYQGTLQEGEAVRIMTGAAMPSGADAVAMQEDAHCSGEQVVIESPVPPGLNVRPRGEQFSRDTVVLPRGRRLRSYDVGLAAAAGATDLTVVRRLKVGVLSTGDELHDAPHARGATGQYDGNRPMLRASLAASGYQAEDLGIVADSESALLGALQAAAGSGLDVVLSTGGVAQGDADIVRRLAALEFIPLALRPGRGIAWGRISTDLHAFWLIGMPGNAVAAYVMYQLLVAPLLAHIAGASAEPRLELQLPLTATAHTRAGNVDWRRGRFLERDGKRAVELLAQQSSSMLRTLSDADALVGIGPEPVIDEGQLVPVIPLAALT